MDADYILILGGPINGTEPSDILFQRVSKAAELLRENAALKAVCSGGIKSEAQPMSEAEIMQNTLLKLGISEDRIILENKAKTTLENFKFTKALLGENAKVCFVTSRFHIYRSCRIMKKAGVCYLPIAAENGSDSLGFRVREAFLRPLARLGIIW
ncbi:MAG: YdcF family protein [Clostridia bacterium]|nr:YdcF family protein [Clostridia bacterium]